MSLHAVSCYVSSWYEVDPSIGQACRRRACSLGLHSLCSSGRAASTPQDRHGQTFRDTGGQMACNTSMDKLQQVLNHPQAV
jgi:hypothetical protein